eukprot:1034675-Rhodomonas_salina.4
MSGTDIAMPGTDIAMSGAPILLHLRYAVSGTDIAYRSRDGRAKGAVLGLGTGEPRDVRYCHSVWCCLSVQRCIDMVDGAIGLCQRYAMSGTDIACSTICLRLSHAVSVLT